MMSNKTLEINSIPIPPKLAGRLKQTLGKTGNGFDEGAFLQQLHYWTLNAATTGWMINGTKWIYNSLKSWQEQFPWMSEYGLRKAIANLKKLGLIQTAQHWITSYKRVMFYRIDYQQLVTFAGDVCDLITDRCVNSDQVDVLPDRMTDTNTSSNTSFSEQQTVVVSEINESLEDTSGLEIPTCDRTSRVEVSSSEADRFFQASSGKILAVQPTELPELINAVAQAIGQSLPAALKKAIAQFPERVQPAITYLHFQQQQRQIKNPVGYLYSAVINGWEITISEPSITPAGFKQWFDCAKRRGLVIAATLIGEIHHTLHVQHGWLPTEQLMQELAVHN